MFVFCFEFWVVYDVLYYGIEIKYKSVIEGFIRISIIYYI